MSKLGDKIRRAARVDAPPLGFAAASQPRDTSMLVVAQVEASALASSPGLMRADAILLEGAPGPKEVAAAVQAARAAGDIPLGVRQQPGRREDLRAAHEAGLDFVVLGLEAPAALLLESGVDSVLAIPPEMPDALLRALESLPAAAILVDLAQPRLTVADRLALTRLAGLARKPLVVRLAEDTALEDLESLRDAGAVAVVLGASGAAGFRRLEAAKEAVSRLPRRRRRGDERPEAILPSLREVAPEEEEGEEEE